MTRDTNACLHAFPTGKSYFFPLVAGVFLLAILCRVPAHAGTITPAGSVDALTDVSQLSGIVGTANFDEGPTSGLVPLTTYTAQGLTFHTGPLNSILAGVTTGGTAFQPRYLSLSEHFPAPIAGGGVHVGQIAFLAGVATFSPSLSVTQVGLTASRNGTQFLTAWDTSGTIIGQITWTPSQDSAFIGIDTFGVPIGMIAYGNDDLFAGASYEVSGASIYSDTWIWGGAPPTLVADLDIKPGSDPNSINLGSRGVLPVAILTTDDFDALDVDVATVLFGDPNGNSIAPLRSGEEDVNDDGLIDLTLKFSMRELVDNGALSGTSVEGILIGLLLDGTPIEGSDSIRLVPPGDANNDQIVDGADYTVWANNFGTNGNGTPGDFDEDNHVDGADYTMWANNFGTDLSAPGSAAAAVPEPSTFVLSTLGLIGLLAYSWRRRRRA